ncbi:MAG: DUF4293 family protein [Balneolaceae bacterium]
MIQRLQTLFLLGAGVLNLSVYFTPIYSHAVNDPAAWIGNGFAILLALSMILAFLSIFLYKDRIRQLKYIKIGITIEIAALAVAAAILFTLGGIGSFLMAEALSVFLLLLALICYWQAGRFVKKDEELVQSMDRIR